MEVLPQKTRIVVVGAGAAGLMAAIEAARRGAGGVVVLDGAAKIGAKILVSGGGRCNLTNAQIRPQDFFGSSPNAVKKVLLGFNLQQTLDFFHDLDLRTKTEDLGKIFPHNDKARSVLDALLRAAAKAGVLVRPKARVSGISPGADGFTVSGPWGRIVADRVILATGGKSLPRSGSDGGGYLLAESLGHTLTPQIHPALVPLLLPSTHCLTGLSGLSADVRLELRSPTGKKRMTVDGALLCTHFGLSGPAVLDISRHYLACEAVADPVHLIINWLPSTNRESLDAELRGLKQRTVGARLKADLPGRLAETIAREANVDLETTGALLTREQRKSLVTQVLEMPAPISGHRGFTFAEVTAGGVPLSQLQLKTMESRVCPGLYLCGEICDVDGRIGGFNFQWAWSSGHLAGAAAAGA
jgi:predicted Rossmann fold flavoprotein